MKPIEFILWMNGAAGVLGDEPPTPEQWGEIKEKLGEAVGGVVSSKLLERAEEVMRDEERGRKRYAEKARLEREMREYHLGVFADSLGWSAPAGGAEPHLVPDHMKDAVGILNKPIFGGKK